MLNHTVKSFDKEIAHLSDEINRLAMACSNQLEKAATALDLMDKDLAGKVAKDDEKVNVLERLIEDHAVRFLAKRQPMAVDLRFFLAAMKIAYELERIGDNAENIAKGVIFLKKRPDQGIVKRIVDMTADCRSMLQEAVEAFLAMDADKASAVWKRDEGIDESFKRIMGLVFDQTKGPCVDCFEDGTQIVLMARCIERIGDHITNIVEDIYYIATGQNNLKQIMMKLDE